MTDITHIGLYDDDGHKIWEGDIGSDEFLETLNGLVGTDRRLWVAWVANGVVRGKPYPVGTTTDHASHICMCMTDEGMRPCPASLCELRDTEAAE